MPLINGGGAVFRSLPLHVACLLRNGPLREDRVTGMFRARYMAARRSGKAL
jgi:hypothetical protein